eukprot:scaffold44016_cov46-Prasinocladus_malaysianus.AAC.1
MAAYVLKNLAAVGDYTGEFSRQGAIRPLVHLLRTSQERNDLENTKNVVCCMELISVCEVNAVAMRLVSHDPPAPNITRANKYGRSTCDQYGGCLVHFGPFKLCAADIAFIFL